MPIDVEKDSIDTALKKLKARENALRRLEAVAKLGSWEVDLKTKKSIWSDRSYEIYGYEPGEIEPTLETFFAHLLPEYVEKAKRLLSTMMQTTDVKTFHAQAKKQNGEVIDILLNGQIIVDEHGTPSKLIGTTQDITEYVALKRQAEELLQIIEKSSNEIYILDVNTLKYLYVNEGAVAKLGYTKEEFVSLDVYTINPYLTEEHAGYIREVLETEGEAINRTIHRCKNGEEYPVQGHLQMIRFQNREAFIIFDTDITQQVETEKKEREKAKIVESMHDGVVVTNLKGEIQNYNHSFVRIVGEQEFTNIIALLGKSNEQEVRTLLQESAECDEEDVIEMELAFMRSDGREIVCELSLTQLQDEQGEVYAIAWMCQDVTHKKYQQQLLKKQAEELEFQAYHDALTALPNRTLFRDRLSQAINYSRRHDKKFALLFVDLDRFKQINDSMGHQFGDAVLLEIAKRIKKQLRSEDTLARFGGDEFVVIARDVTNKKAVEKIASKMLQSFKEPLHVYGQDIYTSISIGISLYPDDSQTEENLIKYADSAMYKAKEEGRSNYRFYSIEMTQNAFEKVVLENALRAAIEQEEFEVFYQPQIDVTRNCMTGMEALVRWKHPELGLMVPGKFLAAAEESGLIVEIDRIVMKKAMEQFVKWKRSGVVKGRLSLNLAMKQLLQEDFLQFLEASLQQSGMQTEWLEFEVTEGDVMRNPSESIKTLMYLHEQGIAIAMDDFGTGYSSLAYITKLPLDKLKIDRSFVIEMQRDVSSMEIVKVVIALAKTLGFDLVAEGVETCTQKDLLLGLGCPVIQGYLYAKPLDAKDAEVFLAKL